MLLENLQSDLIRASNIDAAEVSNLIREVGFRCVMCGWCCRPDPDFMIDIKGIKRPSNAVSVFPCDIKGIMEATGLELLEIVEPDIYSCIKGERTWAIGWILKRKTDGTCNFFKTVSRLCGIYQHRPLICRCYPFFLDSNGGLEVRHCRATRKPLDNHEADAVGKILLEYLITKIKNYIAIAEGMGDKLELKRLCEIKPGNGLELHVFDGADIYVKKYSAGVSGSNI